MGIQEMDIGGHKLTINESDNDLYDPLTGHTLTGSWVWSSSLFLSEWLVSQTRLHLFDLQGKTVLELGAGMGIPGLISARLGAGRVILTDAPPLLPGLQRNVDLNQDQVAAGGDPVEVRELIWGSDVVGELGEVDVVLMSDVFYDESEMESLAKTLKKVCGLKTKVWSATEIRPSTGACLNKLVTEGFEVNEVLSQLGLDDHDHDDAPPLFAVFHIVLRVTESM